MLTWLMTPELRKSSSIRWACVFKVSKSISSFDGTRFNIMAIDRERRFETMGRSAADGSEDIPSTAFFTSCNTSFISYCPVVSMVTTELFSTEVELISFIPTIPRIASSIRLVTPSSISTGEAPG